RVRDQPGQIAHLVDLVALEARDDITLADARGGGRAILGDRGDERAVRLLEAEALGDRLGDLLDLHSQPTAPRLPVLSELVDHAPGERRGDGEADADRAAAGREDRRVDADYLAREIEQRAARVAAVDGGVGLQELVVRSGVDVAMACRQDARGHRSA